MNPNTAYIISTVLIGGAIALLVAVLGPKKQYLPSSPLEWLASALSVAVILTAGALLIAAFRYDVSAADPATGSTFVGLEEYDVNQKAEDFDFRLVENDWVSRLEVYRGEVILLNFWATWCAPCLDEIPALNQLQQKYRDRGLIVISLSDEGRDDLIAFNSRLRLETVSGYAPSVDAMPAVFRNAFERRPTTFLIDREGTIQKYVLGARNFEYFEKLVLRHL